MTEALEAEVARLKKELATQRSALALVTAEKMALESLHGRLPPSRAPKQEQDLAKLHNRVGDLEADLRSEKLAHSDTVTRFEREHKEEIDALKLSNRERVDELRATISSMSQKSEVLKMDDSQVRTVLAKEKEKLAAVEAELAATLLRVTDLEGERDELSSARTRLEGNVELLQHEKAALEKAVGKLKDKLTKATTKTPGRFTFAQKPGELTAEAIRSSLLYHELEASLAHSQLETKIAEQLAGSIQRELRNVREEVELLRADKARALAPTIRPI